MTRTIQKVTAFVTRDLGEGPELLLFKHPNAGIQIPAGTVNPGEAPEDAALREVAEESGLTAVKVVEYLGAREGKLPDNQRIILEQTKVYARPDLTSFDWAYIRPGIPVSVVRAEGGFTQIVYRELDRVPDPRYETLVIKGWVPEGVLADIRLRHFYHLEFIGRSEDHWTVFADNHTFSPFWAPLEDLPEIISPQDQWLEYIKKKF